MPQVTWGNEDIALTKALLKSGLQSLRRCTPELWHMFHKKFVWAFANDGVHRRRTPPRGSAPPPLIRYNETRDWELPYDRDGYAWLIATNKLSKSRCK